ncbi:hypothetical protein QAD02_011315 [Eretmocerus hayati]|uniref:Uncharacterized protein n=1 Tax=Eretmocerus hayati TaxID=131215 RepID=A0ACC2NZ04_9HYME|nr:hypothetical protein QAD02_011315 [Eretmocerus hayati]
MTKLINDDKAMLAGALLLKLDMMISISPLVRLVDPNRLDTDDGESGFKGPYNHSFPLATLHTLEGCVPNVYSFPSQGNQYIICALRPIKAGEPLISYLTSISIWNKRTKAERQERHIETYGCPCNCQACTEDWAESLDNMKDSMILDFRNPIGLKLWEERNSIISDWEANKHKFNFPDIKIVSRAANLVDTAWKEFSMPSAIMLRSVYILEDVLDAFHDPSEICVKNPSLRSLMKYESVYDIQKILKESTNDATNSEKGS